jgi:hypothetical protein
MFNALPDYKKTVFQRLLDWIEEKWNWLVFEGLAHIAAGVLKIVAAAAVGATTLVLMFQCFARVLSGVCDIAVGFSKWVRAGLEKWHSRLEAAQEKEEKLSRILETRDALTAQEAIISGLGVTVSALANPLKMLGLILKRAGPPLVKLIRSALPKTGWPRLKATLIWIESLIALVGHVLGLVENELGGLAGAGAEVAGGAGAAGKLRRGYRKWKTGKKDVEKQAQNQPEQGHGGA